MITKLKIKDELYIYCNGKLMYKRWLKYGYGMCTIGELKKRLNICE